MKREWRLKHNTPMRCLALAEGHAMVRFKGCTVHVIDEAEWLALPPCDHLGALSTAPQPEERGS